MIATVITSVTFCYHFLGYHIPTCRIFVTSPGISEKINKNKMIASACFPLKIPDSKTLPILPLQHNHQRTPSNFGTISYYHFKGVRVTITTVNPLTHAFTDCLKGLRKAHKTAFVKATLRIYGLANAAGTFTN